MGDEFENIIAGLQDVSAETECVFTMYPKTGPSFKFSMQLEDPDHVFQHFTYSMARTPQEIFNVKDIEGIWHALKWKDVKHLSMEQE